MAGKAQLGVRVTVVTAVLLTLLGWCTGDPDQPAATGPAGTATPAAPSASSFPSSVSASASSTGSELAPTGTRSRTTVEDERDDVVGVVARPFAAMHGRSGQVHDHSAAPSSVQPVVPLMREPTDDAPMPSGSPQPTVSTPPAAPVPSQQSTDAVPLPPIPAPEPTYYPNCDAVRAAGQAPLLVGEPGYSGKLDRDGDGIACEVR